MAELPRNPSKDSAFSSLAKSIKGFFSAGGPDPTNPVIGGATVPSRNLLRNILSDVASQGSRLTENFGLLASLTDAKLLKGGLIDDRQYQIEQILQLASSLPVNSKTLDDLTGELIKLLWENLEHPPLSYVGDEFKYRTPDGRNSNIMYPDLGKAGSPYARTVMPQTLQPGVLPDPGVIFDALFARGEEPKEHPSRISSMLFYLASIIIHDLFRTDEMDSSRMKNSSYLDLSPLYGSSQEDQDRIRTKKDGLLKPDAFSEIRLLGFPPGVPALLICFNRYHNYVARQLKEINEGGRFDPNSPKLDNDLFQTARLVTCGLYINIILGDYVRTILNLQRMESTWTLDPRKNLSDVFDQHGVPSGVGNQISVEFNLVYRWHSTISVRDEKWTTEFYQELCPGENLADITEEMLKEKFHAWARKIAGQDPGQRTFDNLKRTGWGRGPFRDEDLVKILTESVEDVACAFGPRNVPVVMRLIEVLGIKQARAWKVATLNEFRKFFKLEPHKQFSDITKDEDVARSLETLYTHPDYVELYPGIMAEDAKLPLEPGSGLCPGFTISRTILSDAVALARGDRFYTVDYTPANLTNWGWSQVKSDPDVAGGGCIYNLFMRAFPFWYRGNSVYALYPFSVPDENLSILKKLKRHEEYDFGRPSYVGMPIPIKTWEGVTTILADQARFKVPWGAHTFNLTGHDYMLSGDSPANSVQHKEVYDNLYCPVNGLDQVKQFYEDLTTQLVETRSQKLRGDLYQLDAVRDVGNQSHAIFVARMFHLRLTTPDDLKPGITVDQLYLGLSVLFAYVFLDLDTARSFKLHSAAKTATDGIAKLVKIVCEAVAIGKHFNLGSLLAFWGTPGKLLGDYGVRLLERLFESGKSVDEVVWAIIPTIAAAVATQAQHFAQMLDLYLQSEYHQKHWDDIQACAWSNDPKDFEKLKKYALEANRLAPAAFGLIREAAVDTTIYDGRRSVDVKVGDKIYTDFVEAGLDASRFPRPKEINLDRDSGDYIHQGWGAHRCIGRPIVEVAMASQLKVFAKLKNLKRAPGLQGEMKFTIPEPNPVSSDPKPNPGNIKVYMKEDWSDWWPFPTTMKVHHNGFVSDQAEYLAGKTGLPDVEDAVLLSDMHSMELEAGAELNGKAKMHAS